LSSIQAQTKKSGQLVTGKLDQIIDSTNLQTDAIKSLGGAISQGLDDIAAGIDNLTSILEWGLEGLRWEMRQQTALLGGISTTLKTPRQTEAEELRQIAEGLRVRAMYEEARQRFQQALDLNPLDFRIYFGLGLVLLQLGEVGEAMAAFEKSLRVAGYVSLQAQSHRIIGRIHFSQGAVRQALASLQTAIQLDSGVPLYFYDAAQYAALTSRQQPQLVSAAAQYIKEAITLDPGLAERALLEHNLDPVRKEVGAVIRDSIQQASVRIKQIMDRTKSILGQYEAENKGVPVEVSQYNIGYISDDYKKAQDAFHRAVAQFNTVVDSYNSARTYAAFVELCPE
jgi:tetratricopeptide (TPR) repeat protein